MDQKETYDLLRDVAEGRVTVEEAVLKLKKAPFEELDYAKVDTHRGLRQGAGEVIYGAGKTAEQILGIIRAMSASGQKRILITRLSAESAGRIAGELPQEEEAVCFSSEGRGGDSSGEEKLSFRYYENAKVGIIGGMSSPGGHGSIVVATGGTSDIPVAEEAALTAEFLGNEVIRLYDVGVAGLHRLMKHMDEIMSASVIIAVAGMEGALASVIGGLADCPVIAVPTSVGYGASFGGISALLSMLNSCASGVSVVNIDNGFGAGYQAGMMNHIKGKKDEDIIY